MKKWLPFLILGGLVAWFMSQPKPVKAKPLIQGGA
jgi:hypothetical protein